MIFFNVCKCDNYNMKGGDEGDCGGKVSAFLLKL
jgi:hypothetical protein